MCASEDPKSTERRLRLREEMKYIKELFTTKDDNATFHKWLPISMALRVPTTNITYVRTLISDMGGKAVLSERNVKMVEGFEELYGTSAWYERPPDLTPQELRLVITSKETPLWVRVRTEFEYLTTSRDADLTYLGLQHLRHYPEQGEIHVQFPHLKNDATGEMGVIKVLRPINYQQINTYLKMQQKVESIQLFPQDYANYLKQLKIAVGRQSVGTRGLRRGAAVVASEVAKPKVIKDLLAHKGLGTQRTYTEQLTAHERDQQLRVQLHLTSATPSLQARRYTPTMPVRREESLKEMATALRLPWVDERMQRPGAALLPERPLLPRLLKSALRASLVQ